MPDRDFLTVSTFARYARTTKETLRFYDKIGLLRPAVRRNNNYRYYSITQVGSVNMIRIMQELGMSLAEIKEIMDKRTPQSIEELFSQHINIVDTKLDGWARARKLLLTAKKTIHEARNIDETAITLQFLPAEAIILGDINDYSRGRTDYDALVDFYKTTLEKYPDIDVNYSVWGVFSQERVLQGDFAWPDRYYFYNPEGHDRKPAAQYVIGYMRGRYGDGAELFERLLKYISDNKLEIQGESYKEYPLNEVCITDADNYLIKVMIPVTRRKSKSSLSASTTLTTQLKP